MAGSTPTTIRPVAGTSERALGSARNIFVNGWSIGTATFTPGVCSTAGTTVSSKGPPPSAVTSSAARPDRPADISLYARRVVDVAIETETTAATAITMLARVISARPRRLTTSRKLYFQSTMAGNPKLQTLNPK